MWLAAAVFAQPGDYKAILKDLVERHLRSIAELDRQIASRPSEGQLYFKRGAEYAGLYRTLYRGLTGVPYPDRAKPTLTAVYISQKAIEDLDRAAKTVPAAEIFSLRGDMYSARWRALNQLDWGKVAGSAGDPEWSDLIGEPDEKKLLDAFSKFITDKDFARAVDDYTLALKGNLDNRTRWSASSELAELYVDRVSRVPIRFPAIKRLVTGKNQFRYSIMDDLDKAIGSFSDLSTYERREKNDSTTANIGVSLMNLYFSKAKLAMTLGLYPTALETFTKGAYIGETAGSVFYKCEYYSKYADLLFKMGNNDEAIATALKVTTGEPAMMCEYAHEPLGDAWFSKGEYEKAATEYQIALRAPYLSPSALELYKKAAIALQKAGKPLEAVHAMGSYIRDPESNPTAADYRFRSQLYRDAGHRGLGIGDDQRAAALEREYGATGVPASSLVYGKVVMPDGKPVTTTAAGIVLKYADGTGDRQTQLDSDGRFIFRAVKNVSFALSAYAEITTDGTTRRYAADTSTFAATKATTGPITITLAER